MVRKKSIWAFALIFSMIFSLFAGISARAEGNEGSSDNGLVVAWTDWNETEDSVKYPVKKESDEDYWTDIRIYAGMPATLYLGWSKDNPITEDDFNSMLVEKLVGEEYVNYQNSNISLHAFPEGVDIEKTRGFLDVEFSEEGEYKILFNCKSVNIHVDPPKNGFFIAGTDWYPNEEGGEDRPHSAVDPEQYGKEWTFEVKTNEYVSLCKLDDNSIVWLSGDDITIYQDGRAIIDEGSLYNYDDMATFLDGTFRLRFDVLGHYQICYNGMADQNFVTVNVVMPRIAIYSSDQMSAGNIECSAHENFVYTPGKSYYLAARDDIISDTDITSAYVSFGDKLAYEDFDWKKSGFAPYEIKIPDGMVDYDEINVNITRKDGSKDWLRFGFEPSKEGLVISDVSWDDDGSGHGRPYPRTYSENFGKGWSGQALYENDITLGFNNNGSIDILDKDDLNKLSIIKADGTPLEKGKDYEIGNSSYSYWGGEEETVVPVEDVFSIMVKKPGDYRIVYTDGASNSMVSYHVDMPDMGIYGKKIYDDRFLIGGDSALYSDTGEEDIRIFYIMPYSKSDENHKKEVKVISKAKINSSDSTVSTDLETGIIKVKIGEEETEPVEVYVKAENTDYHADESSEDGWTPDTDPENPQYENPRIEEYRFVFSKADGNVFPYDAATAEDVNAAEFFEREVENLPEPEDVTLDYEVISAVQFAVNIRDGYEDETFEIQGLTDEQKALVDDEVFEKLEAVEAALNELIVEAEANAAAAEAVIEEIEKYADSAKITAEDKEAIESIKEAYDKLTDDQKKLIDEDTVKTLEKALTAVTVAVTKAEDEKEKSEAIEAAVKEATAALQKVADAEKAAAVEAAKKVASKNASPAAGAVIYDTKSKAIYKVITSATEGSTGTVEYKRPDGSPKKANIPETITVNDFKYEVVSIGDSAFEDCTKLKTVTIPSKVISIGAKAFSGCKKLKTIKIKSSSIKKIGKTAFKGINKKAKFKVPKKNVKTYKKLIKKAKAPKTVKVTK